VARLVADWSQLQADPTCTATVVVISGWRRQPGPRDAPRDGMARRTDRRL